jgi:nucleotide-binding universal stress UspA family protein
MTLSSHPQVVFATDFSDGAAVAAEVAADYARRLGARLHVLHVTRRGWEDEMRNVLRQYVRRFADIEVTAGLETGSAAERIVDYATEQGADLVVLGARGRTGFSRALLGSVAEQVARTARCPVLTVPREQRITPEAARGEVALATVAAQPCLVCQQPTTDQICPKCQARIRGDALERKLEVERKAPL